MVKIEIQNKGSVEIDTKDFNLKEAVEIINGMKTDSDGNRIPGFMVGDKHYFRALEVVSIEVL